MNLKRLELHDGTIAIVNATQVLWLEPRDPKMTRIHFNGSTAIHVKGSVSDVARQLTQSI